MLTAQEILDQKILNLTNTEGSPAQVGYDLSIAKISEIEKPGMVFIEKTRQPVLREIVPRLVSDSRIHPEVEGNENKYRWMWRLKKGAYDVVFNEGCDIPANLSGFIRQRSSLLRSGVLIQSSIFDPGFKTEQMGCVMIVTEDGFQVERDARVAQIYFHEHNPVAELYVGQYQGDKQRSK